MKRLLREVLYVMLAGIVGAGIVHIVIVLLIPAYSERDAWSLLSAAAEPFELVALANTQLPLAGNDANPFLESAVCVLDLSEGVAELRGEGKAPFWSIAVYDRWGQSVFSLTDRTAVGGLPHVAVATPLQILDLRKSMPERLEDAVIVEMEETRGVLVVRAFRPDPSYAPVMRRFFDGLACAPV